MQLYGLKEGESSIPLVVSLSAVKNHKKQLECIVDNIDYYAKLVYN